MKLVRRYESIDAFDFETDVATGSAVCRLVYTRDGWKAVTLCTNVEGLNGYPERLGPLRNFDVYHVEWAERRKSEQAFEDRDPEVLIIGGGHSGLSLAARLKMLNTSHLVIEKDPRVGDVWRKRYDTMCLHDPVCE